MTDPTVDVLTGVLIVITAYYAITNHMMFKHMKSAHLVEQAADVLIYFDVPYGTEFIYLIIKNVGKSSAQNIHLTFDPPLQDSRATDMSSLPMVNHIESIAPGVELRHFLDGVIDYFGNKNLPLVYHVKISHSDRMSKRETLSEQTLDLSSYTNLHYLRTRGLDELVGTVEELAMSQAKLAAVAEKLSARFETGIRVSNAQSFNSSILTDRDIWTASALAKFMEVSIYWQILGERKLTPELRSHTVAAAEEMILLSACIPMDLATDIRSILTDTAAELLSICDTPRTSAELRDPIIAFMDSACHRIREGVALSDSRRIEHQMPS